MSAGAAWTEPPEFDLPSSGCLDFLLPALPSWLVSDADRQWIGQVSRQIPPVPRIALELRLGGGAKRVDLHQRFYPRGGDPRVLDRYLSQAATPPLCERHLRAFLSEWANREEGAAEESAPVYLEWDRPAVGGEVGAPGVFLPIESPGHLDSERTQRRVAVLRHAEQIDPAMGPVAAAAIDLLGASLPQGASLHFIGFMIGRAAALRVNVRGIPLSDLAPFLDRIGWPGDGERAACLFEQLVQSSDRVIVALDFAPGLLGRIGFETILDFSPQQDSHWAQLFDLLVANGLCDQREREVLEAFPGTFYPESGQQAWPAAWLIAALRSPTACLPWVERRISHVKVTVDSDECVSAKAYVSAEHHWFRNRGPAPSTASVDDAIAMAASRATAFLIAALGQDDLWRDFSMPGPSDEWVTAFVGYVLATGRDERAHWAVERSARALLGRQRKNGGWGYNGNCPPDADSTAWALRFLDAAGYAGPEVDHAKSFLFAHQLKDGSFSTYVAGAPMRFHDRAWHGPSEGWTGRHSCVTANAASALKGQGSEALLGSQKPEGYWAAYWWRNNSFSTALAVEALALGHKNDVALDRAMCWARSDLEGVRSAFDRAWLSRILDFGDGAAREQSQHVRQTLAAEQEADGGWPSGAALLLPHPSDFEPTDDLVPFLDRRRLFTTASVLMALKSAAKR